MSMGQKQWHQDPNPIIIIYICFIYIYYIFSTYFKIHFYFILFIFLYILREETRHHSATGHHPPSSSWFGLPPSPPGPAFSSPGLSWPGASALLFFPSPPLLHHPPFLEVLLIGHSCQALCLLSPLLGKTLAGDKSGHQHPSVLTDRLGGWGGNVQGSVDLRLHRVGLWCLPLESVQVCALAAPQHHPTPLLKKTSTTSLELILPATSAIYFGPAPRLYPPQLWNVSLIHCVAKLPAKFRAMTSRASDLTDSTVPGPDVPPRCRIL
jgi:hypothetical protein